ncbi:MAG: zinc-ribbon domain-containing protein [Acidobacteriota bacterium]|nr:zinc-ribbon domain-containing protein [Acidobacteriota bacterium]
MIIVCQKCSTRLQVDDTKIPAGQFAIRCPKCNSSLDSSSSSPTTEQSATAVGGSPATSQRRSEQSKAAPLFELEGTPSDSNSNASAADKLVELLSGLANQPGFAGANSPNGRPSWNPRKMLVCVPEENRETVARGLAENGYQVFVAEDTRQAVERMREHMLDMVLLDPRFDPGEQGAAFVMREVNILRPVQRRRLFFVLLSPTLRTMDGHAAFLNNVNAIVNVNDVGEIPKLLENRLREYNELYKDFNSVMRVPAL